MASIHANGAGVRHAISRALATANLAPRDAVFRVKRARVDLDRQGDVARAEVSIDVQTARPLTEYSPEELRGLVNPDGEHPLMVWLPGAPAGDDPDAGVAPFFMDMLAVSWSRWLDRYEGTLPPGFDIFAPVVGPTAAEATAFAVGEAKRLPTLAEFRHAWGTQPLPWGEAPDPSCGRVGRPRYDVLPEGGMHPPTHDGLFDIGAWLWQRLEDGRVAGGGTAADGLAVSEAGLWPVGIRLVQDA